MKNIIYITGNDSYGREKEVKRWLKVFEEKYGVINIDRYRLDERKSLASLKDLLTMTGLFSEKRLFLFSGGIERKTKEGGFEEILSRIEIPEDHFCLFYNISKREEGLIDWLKKNADVRLIDTLWSEQEWAKRFSHIDTKTLKKVLDTYRFDTLIQEKDTENDTLGHMIANNLEMIGLSDTSRDLDSMIHTRGGGKIFDLIDAILAGESKKTLILVRKISETMPSNELLSSLINLLRSHLYIQYCIKKGLPENSISKYISVHPFVIKKSLQSRISFDILSELMQKLNTASIAYKSGKGRKDAELGRIFSIELALMTLKK